MVVIIMGILFLAVLMDLFTNKIPNALILISLFIGILINIKVNGPPGLIESLKTIIISFIFFYIFYIINALGAGDVKLFIVIALYLGVKFSIKILIISFIAAALYGSIKILISVTNSIIINHVKKGEMLRTIQNNSQKIDLILINMTSKLKSYLFGNNGRIELTRVPFTPFMLLALVIVWRVKL